MMNKILTTMALALMVVACTQKEDQPVQYGEISVKLANETAVDVTTKASEGFTTLTAAQAADYLVSITGDGYAGYSTVYKDFQTQTLPLGTYYISAENVSADAAVTGKGSMHLAGTEEVTLSVENLTATVEVECSVTNSKVTVEFDSAVAGRFTGLKVEVTGDRTFTVLENGTASGDLQSVGNTELWFNPGEVSYKITGVFTQTGKNIELTGSKTLAARNHMKLVVKVNLENGQISATPTISINTNLTTETVSPEINPYN